MRIVPSSAFSSAKPISDRSENVFRLDINGLRALSVVAVVGFHLKIPSFAGGFVGVDIFLVITGYLMTLKVLRDLAQARFSFWGFWIMRMRRIYPALVLVTVVTVIAGWCLTMPDQYLKHLLSHRRARQTAGGSSSGAPLSPFAASSARTLLLWLSR